MTLKTCLNWLKYSGVWIGFVLNPYQWEPDIKFTGRNEYDEGSNAWGLMFFELNLGLIWIRIVIDDGRW